MKRPVLTKVAQASNPRVAAMDRVLAQFPKELIALPQWVLWKLERRNGKTTKIPYQPNGMKAGSTSSATWSDFQTVMGVFLKNPDYSGVGFVFSSSDPYAGIDLDKCRDPVTGVVEPWAAAVLGRISTYTELSPSGTGFHMLGKGKLPAKGRRKDRIEMYDSGRYFTVTGEHYGQSPCDAVDIQASLSALHAEILGTVATPAKGQPVASVPTLPALSAPRPASDQTVADTVLASRDAEAFRQFQAGHWAALDYPSQSEGDLALVGMLARHAGPHPEQIDRLFRSTGMMRDKWDEMRGANTYGEMTIAKVLEGAAVAGAAEAFVVRLNQRFAVITNSNQVKILDEGPDEDAFRLLSKTDFELLTCNTPSPQAKKSAANLWLHSPDRREFAGLVFRPGKDAVGNYNMWRGFSVKAQPGHVSLFWKLVREAICAGSDEIYDYVRCYFAHMVQRPWERPEVAIVLRGGQGTGKNTFVDTMGSLVARHFCEVSSVDQLTGRFNAHMRNIILMHANEATWGGNRSDIGKLKALITDETIPIEMKGQDILHIENFLRLVVSSNESWPVPVDADDRRFLILDVSPVFKQDTTFFAALHAELAAGGREALMNDLETQDLTGFLPRNKPATPFGADIKIRSADSPTRWLYEALSGNAWPHNGLAIFAASNAVAIMPKNALAEDYKQWCGSTSERSPVPRDQLFKRVRELLGGSMTDSRPSAATGQTRPRELIWASIEDCRQAFAVSAGIAGAIVWEAV